MGNNNTGRAFNATARENMAAYDKLSRALRDALKYADHNYSAAQAYRALRKRKANRHPAAANTAALMAHMSEQDAKHHAAGVASGYVAPKVC